MTDGTFRCEACQTVFHKGQTDEEAELEYQRLFTEEERQSPPATICDDCWHAMEAAGYFERLDK